MHNVHYLLNLMKEIRQAIVDNRYPEFVASFFAKLYPKKDDIPQWVTNALGKVDIDLLNRQ